MMRSVRLAERDAESRATRGATAQVLIGVDRIYRELVLLGHRPPRIVGVADTVRCVLIGGDPVEPVTSVTSLLGDDARADIDIALVPQ